MASDYKLFTSSEETRITDEATGGQKGAKLAQLGALDPLTLIRLAEVAGFGADKYESFNMLKGYDWSLSFNALQRHLLAFWAGEELDPESGLPHLGHAAWHCLTLLAFQERGLGTDDRYVQPECASDAPNDADGPSEAPGLKPGDRVRVARHITAFARAGDLGTVVKVDGSRYPVTVGLDRLPFESYGLRLDELESLELISRPEER